MNKAAVSAGEDPPQGLVGLGCAAKLITRLVVVFTVVIVDIARRLTIWAEIVECKNIDFRRRTFAHLIELAPDLATLPRTAGYMACERQKMKKKFSNCGGRFIQKGFLNLFPFRSIKNPTHTFQRVTTVYNH